MAGHGVAGILEAPRDVREDGRLPLIRLHYEALPSTTNSLGRPSHVKEIT